MPRYFANCARDKARVGPGELPFAIGVFAAPDAPMPVGIAFPVGHVGGWLGDEYLGKPEATWRLVIGKEEVDGRFALRLGAFVELGDQVI